MNNPTTGWWLYYALTRIAVTDLTEVGYRDDQAALLWLRSVTAVILPGAGIVKIHS